jgi:hypothetical protein
MSELSEFIKEFDYLTNFNSDPRIEKIVWQEKVRKARLQMIKTLTSKHNPVNI